MNCEVYPSLRYLCIDIGKNSQAAWVVGRFCFLTSRHSQRRTPCSSLIIELLPVVKLEINTFLRHIEPHLNVP